MSVILLLDFEIMSVIFVASHYFSSYCLISTSKHTVLFLYFWCAIVMIPCIMTFQFTSFRCPNRQRMNAPTNEFFSHIFLSVISSYFCFRNFDSGANGPNIAPIWKILWPLKSWDSQLSIDARLRSIRCVKVILWGEWNFHKNVKICKI